MHRGYAFARMVSIEEVMRAIRLGTRTTKRPETCYDSRMDDQPSQTDKFRDAAKQLGCDEDEARWDERLRKVAKQKPVEKPE